MEFDSYSGRPIQLAVDLVNAVGADGVATEPAVEEFVRRHGLRAEHRSVEGDVAGLVRLATSLRGVFATDDPAVAAEVVNGELARLDIAPHLSNHDGLGWHVHFVPPDAGLYRWLASSTGMALATLVAADGVGRFGLCAARGCANAYVDTSRNRSRRFCSDACATRTKVAAHRARRREPRPAPPT